MISYTQGKTFPTRSHKVFPTIHRESSLKKFSINRPENNLSMPFGHMSDSMSFSIGHSYFLSDIKVKKCRVYLLIVTSLIIVFGVFPYIIISVR